MNKTLEMLIIIISVIFFMFVVIAVVFFIILVGVEYITRPVFEFLVDLIK